MRNRLNYGDRHFEDFRVAMRDYGWVIFENALDSDFVAVINEDLKEAYVKRRAIQEKNGISANMVGTLHHLVEKDNFSLPFIEKMYCADEIAYFLSGNYILNGFNAVIHTQQQHPYVSNMHRDVRTFMGDTKLLVQMIVTLDDFTEENGATYFLSGSHKTDIKPNETYFYETADRAVTPRGSIILFDSNIWHAAGENKTIKQRRALTLGFTRPFIKPQMDYPRVLGYDFIDKLSADQRQVLGYNSRIPENLDEYYQPIHLRMYKSDQG